VTDDVTWPQKRSRSWPLYFWGSNRSVSLQLCEIDSWFKLTTYSRKQHSPMVTWSAMSRDLIRPRSWVPPKSLGLHILTVVRDKWLVTNDHITWPQKFKVMTPKFWDFYVDSRACEIDGWFKLMRNAMHILWVQWSTGHMTDDVTYSLLKYPSLRLGVFARH